MQRKLWIDALRAMAMIFVVFGHQAQWCETFFLYTTPIKIPLFFAISGYLLNYHEGHQLLFLKNVFLKLVLPFFFLVTIPVIFFIPQGGFGILLDAWMKMISGDSFWFITCLIVAEIMHFYIRKIGKTIFWIILLCFTCFLVGLILARNELLDYGKLNTALISQVFLLIGYIFRQYEKQLNKLNIWEIIVLLSFYFVLCYISKYLFDSNKFDCNRNLYYNIPYCLMLIILGCTSLFLLVKKITKFPFFLIYIGKNTFILYLWAGYSLLFFVILSKWGIVLPEKNLLYSILQTIWAVTTCMLAAYLLNRFLPFVMGKRKE